MKREIKKTTILWKTHLKTDNPEQEQSEGDKTEKWKYEKGPFSKGKILKGTILGTTYLKKDNFEQEPTEKWQIRNLQIGERTILQREKSKNWHSWKGQFWKTKNTSEEEQFLKITIRQRENLKKGNSESGKL